VNRFLAVPALLAVGIAPAPVAQAYPGDQADAEQAVTAIYDRVQRGCTPSMSPSLQSISWSRFNPESGGEGRIVDAHQGLGGPFIVTYWNPKVGPAQDSPPYRAYGQWGVNLEFC
jgi:hypothetical protein